MTRIKVSKTVKITNPEKEIFHQLHLNKLDVINYYTSIQKYILPYLINRLQYFRWHKGSTKDSEYTKSLESLKEDWWGELPSWVQQVPIYSVSYKKERHYFALRDFNDLLLMLEIGCIEISPWHSVIENIENPDYIIIDLDPVEMDFKYVAEVAIISKKVLTNLKIPVFIKTSGNRGMHLYIPLDGKSDYDMSRSLCEILCALIYVETKELTSLERSPEKRKEKIYLDWLQNGRGKTIVAPYSLRPNDFAGVATPLHWTEVKKTIKTEDFNIFNTIKRLETKKDPFTTLFSRKINAVKVLKELKERFNL